MNQVDKLIKDNIKLVYYVIHKLGLRIDDDLVSEGRLALIIAAKGYSPDKGVKFSTYATKTIRGYLLTYVNRKSSIIKPLRNGNKYIQAPMVDIEDDILWEIAWTEDDEIMESKIFVDDFIKSLSKREQIVVNGLLKDKTQAEIGKELSISQVQVYRIINVIRGKLRLYITQSQLY